MGSQMQANGRGMGAEVVAGRHLPCQTDREVGFIASKPSHYEYYSTRDRWKVGQ